MLKLSYTSAKCNGNVSYAIYNYMEIPTFITTFMMEMYTLLTFVVHAVLHTFFAVHVTK